jgi:hypothetical protein
MKTILFLLVSAALAFGQFNFSGYRDTAYVSDFQSDSAGVTRAFELSRYENLRLYACADDTTEAGYDSDSICFQWGIEMGDIVLNTSGTRDTTWQERYVVDTFDIITTANMVKPVLTLDSIGMFNNPKSFIDTVNVSGWAVQNCEPFYRIPWSPIYRFWYAGLAGNRIEDGFIPLMFGQTRRFYVNVHNN